LISNFDKQFKTASSLLSYLPFIIDLHKIKIFKSKLAIRRKEQRKKRNTKLYLQRKFKREQKLKEQLKFKKLNELKYRKYKQSLKLYNL
jgi:hypothetical protein